MAREWLRFGVSDGQSNWAATWKLWATASSDRVEVSLGSRFLGGRLTASREDDGGWAVAFVRPGDDPACGAGSAAACVGEVEEPHHAQQIADGCALAFRILTPASSVNLPHLAGRFRYVAWIPKAPPAKWVEATVVITESRPCTAGWQAQDLYGRALLGSLVLPAGQRVSVFFRTIDAPRHAMAIRNSSACHEAKSSPHSKYLTVAREPAGAMVVHDLVSCTANKVSLSDASLAEKVSGRRLAGVGS